MKNPPRNVAASVRHRLLNLSKASGVDYNQLLIRYAIERLLYRLSRYRHRANFVLKGAMLFVIWEGSPHGPTQDVDLLGFGDRSPDRIASVFRELCETSVEDDGITFAAKTVQADEMRTPDEYGGVRVRFTASLGGAVIRVQAMSDLVMPLRQLRRNRTIRRCCRTSRRRTCASIRADLPDVIAEINRFAESPLLAASTRQPFANKRHSGRGRMA